MKVKKLLAVLLMTTMLTACSFNGGGEQKPDDNTPVVPVPGGDDNGQGNEQGGEQKTLSSISVEGPTKTQYFVGDQALDLTGLVVTAHYSDNSTAAVTDGYTLSNVDFSAAGPQTVTVTYEGKTATFNVTIVAVAVTGIAVTQNPNKVEYVEGEQLDLTGLVVTATYNNGGSATVANADLQVGAVDMANAGPKVVTVTYEGQSATFNITVVAPNVSRIEIVTEPTKLTYVAGESLDFTGMVVKAFFTNDTERELEATEYTTNAEQLDMKASGSKQVVVSFGGQTDDFAITVNAPEDWDAETKALFNQYAFGVQIPFFYAYDLGLGELEWSYENGVLSAVGANIQNVNDVLEECEPILALFQGASGWTVLSDGSSLWNYQVVFAQEVEGVEHFVQVDFGAMDNNGDWTGSGAFTLEIKESDNAYSWAATGLEAKLKAFFETTEDIPDLPFSFAAYMSASDIEYAEEMLDDDTSRSIDLWIYSEQSFLSTLLNTFKTATWITKTSSTGFVAYSPLESYKVSATYSSYFEQVKLSFTVPETLPDYVGYAAIYYNLSQYQFSASSSGGYFYTFTEQLGAGETLADLVPEYAATLLADPADGFAAKEAAVVTGTSGSGYDYAYRTFVSLDLEMEVEIFAYGILPESGEGYEGVYVQISVDEYRELPQYVKDFCTLTGYSEDEFSYNAGEWLGLIDFPASATTLQAGLKSLTDVLDADNTLNYRALDEVGEYTLSDGVTPCLYVEYANDNSKIEILVYGTTIQLTMYPYTPAPVNTFIPAIEALLGKTLVWDDSDQTFSYFGLLTLPEGKGNDDIASELAATLTAETSLDFYVLLDDGDEEDYVVILYNDEGYVKILATANQYQAGNVLVISAGLFDSTMPFVANLISAAMGIHLEEDSSEPGLYLGETYVNFGALYPVTTIYQYAIGYIVGDLMSSALPFANTDGYMDGSNLVLVYTAEIEIDTDVYEYWAIEVEFVADADGNYVDTLIYVYQYTPSPDPDPAP